MNIAIAGAFLSWMFYYGEIVFNFKVKKLVTFLNEQVSSGDIIPSFLFHSNLLIISSIYLIFEFVI